MRVPLAPEPVFSNLISNIQAKIDHLIKKNWVELTSLSDRFVVAVAAAAAAAAKLCDGTDAGVFGFALRQCLS